MHVSLCVARWTGALCLTVCARLLELAFSLLHQRSRLALNTNWRSPFLQAAGAGRGVSIPIPMARWTRDEWASLRRGHALIRQKKLLDVEMEVETRPPSLASRRPRPRRARPCYMLAMTKQFAKAFHFRCALK